jgi:predicted nucleic acid-binding protein
VSEAVLDASVVLKWFRAAGEARVPAARSLRINFEKGDLAVVAPRLLYLEIVNVAGRRWRWPRKALVGLALALEELQFDLREPSLETVAQWTARGLTAYDASYVALAESQGIPLITDDDFVLTTAPRVAFALAGVN